MSKARNYEEWKQAAIEFDERNGLHNWKLTEQSPDYDNAAIRRRLDKLETLRNANDNHALLFNLNQGIHGNLGGMGHPALYQKAKFGTKQLIVDYVDEVASALTHLAKPRVKGVTHDDKVDFFNRAHLCFGSSALLMSGAGTYLFFHVGVLKSLWEQDLIPRVLSGSSGGALIAAVVGSRKPQQLEEVFDPAFFDQEADDLQELVNDYSFFKKTKVNGDNVKKVVEHLIPDLTFAEAYEESGLQINVSIAPAEKHQKSRLLNAITSPNVMLREAVLASCCVPGVFPPVTLAAKDVNDNRVPYLPNRKWVDGSLSDDLPMKRLSRLYGVNHFIVSQTNPLVLPFIDAEKNSGGLVATVSATSYNTIKSWGLAASHLLQRPFNDDSYISKLINGYISVVSQSYTGDINILPSRILNPTTALQARTTQQIEDMILDGERSSWPVIEKIRIQTKISRILDRITEDLMRKSMHKEARAKKDLKLVAK
ncbi:MAG: DUF3336 domain-containing protein [Arenicella sp.]|nr:DUF3336 domain-containing protein [Arenicella sp.]